MGIMWHSELLPSDPSPALLPKGWSNTRVVTLRLRIRHDLRILLVPGLALATTTVGMAFVSFRNSITPNGIVIHHLAVPRTAVKQYNATEIDHCCPKWN